MKLTTRSIFGFAATILSTQVGLAQTDSNAVQCGQNYTVVAGDTLSQISARAYGTTVFQPLYTQNIEIIGPNPNFLLVGTSLEIPCLASNDGVTAAVSSEEDEVVADASVDTQPGDDSDVVELTFNKTSVPPFIINSGIVDLYLAEVTEVTDGRVRFVDPEVVSRDDAEQFDLVTSGAVASDVALDGWIG